MLDFRCYVSLQEARWHSLPGGLQGVCQNRCAETIPCTCSFEVEGSLSFFQGFQRTLAWTDFLRKLLYTKNRWESLRILTRFYHSHIGWRMFFRIQHGCVCPVCMYVYIYICIHIHNCSTPTGG